MSRCRVAAAGLLAFLIATHDEVRASPDPVHVNQHGYSPGENKWVAAGSFASAFEVKRASDGALVMSGPLTLRRAADPASGDDVYAGDFTSLTVPGRYFIRVPDIGDSPEFLIHEGIYDDLYRKLLKGLYYQRCGTAIPPALGGAWTHDACHDEGASIASYDWSTTRGVPGGYLDTAGGWHDAGDYGKYSTNNAYAVGILLEAYELYPARYAHDDCGLPESGNGIPDLLDEARWSLDWMLKMQEPSGAVKHRESIAAYGGDFIPESDPLTRYHTSISSDATAVHAAAMALAGRTFQSFDPTFAAACSTSAARAWNWLLANPSRVPAGGFTNLYGHTQATYILGGEVGRRLWAAAEIFRLNGNAGARSYVDAHWGPGRGFDGVWYPDSWADVANMGAFTYRDTPGATSSVVSGQWWSIQNSVLSSSAAWQSRHLVDGYGCVASSGGAYGDYYWGFTGVVLRYAWTLIQGFRYSGNASFEQAAREQLHYILGRNPMGKTYATGLGDRPVLHAHGAWNFAAGFTNVEDALCRPVPYLLVGGPNKADNSQISPFPGRCYEDIADPAYFYKGNYTLNETAVNIQASLIVLAGYFSTGGTATGVPGEGAPEARRPAMSVFPNPFGRSARFSWESPFASCEPAEAQRTLVIFDVSGQPVARLLASPSADRFLEVVWDGRTLSGARASNGVFFARVGTQGVAPQRVVRVGGE